MHTTIITDCADENAVARLSARTASLLDSSVHVLRLSADLVGSSSDIAAAGHLIDILDAYEDREWIVLVNVAPRGGSVRHDNGTPFGFFRYRRILVVSTLGGYALSLAKSLGLSEIRAFDIASALASLPSTLRPDANERDRIAQTQFRSYEFQPRAAAWLAAGTNIASEPYDLSRIPELPPSVWHVDNFGNAKTTLLADETILGAGSLSTRYGVLPVFRRLADVPADTLAAVAGSSGIDRRRFVEIVVQRGSAAERADIRTGDSILG